MENISQYNLNQRLEINTVISLFSNLPFWKFNQQANNIMVEKAIHYRKVKQKDNLNFHYQLLWKGKNLIDVQN